MPSSAIYISMYPAYFTQRVYLTRKSNLIRYSNTIGHPNVSGYLIVKGHPRAKGLPDVIANCLKDWQQINSPNDPEKQKKRSNNVLTAANCIVVKKTHDSEL